MKKFITKKNLGYTLIELTMTIAILTFLIGAVMALASYYFRTYSFSFEENQSISYAQTGLTQMIREIREARGAQNGAWPLVEMTDNLFSFYSDVTNDGLSDKVRYFLDGSDLKRGVIEPSGMPVEYPPENESISIISSFVNNQDQPVFTYYNGSWPADTVNNPLAQEFRLMSTRLVKIYLRIDINPDSGSQPFEMESAVVIRSLKDNL